MRERKKPGPAKFKRFRRWSKASPEEKGERVVVMTSPDFKNRVGEVAESLGMPAQALWLEAMKEKLAALEKKGVVAGLKRAAGGASERRSRIAEQQATLFDV